ncbi:glucose-1-phosphate thymidylyltransferase [Actinomadura flavalba]|uniref:glucose-1-phosphate thymidylyltransferase n=1 Tax=Actinomadura flavalba TaxID=1120938 RepID=UPI00036F9C7A|nr:glucose-1-phosphate thymidylyltransferase [Actinomadura flavalba]
MKALVLAGGSGSRLRPFSHSAPKQLLPIANRPVLEYALENLRAAGIHDVGVIVGDRGDQIRDALGDGSRLGLRLTYLRQDRPLGLAHCVRVARDFLAADDFVLYLGDVMLLDGVGALVSDFGASRPAAQLAVHRVDDPRAFGVVELDAEGRVAALVEKPEEPRSDLVLSGAFAFTSAIHAAVDAITPSRRGELELTDAVQWLVTGGAAVRVTRQPGFVADTGRPEDVLACHRRVLDALPVAAAPDGAVEASELTGAVRIEPGARVTASRITGPVVIGAGARLHDCVVGPHVSVGGDCALTGAGITDSIVLDGASVSDVRGIRGSIIGRSVRIAGRADAAHRLLVGDHGHVDVGSGDAV